MSTCWAIIIGINQYHGFQALMQAQNDAVGIRRYLIDDAGFPPENCILLSDLSTSTDQEAVYPDQVAINDWLETICQGRVQQDDTLWFFFSGYGAQADNKDYLMPVDGDPARIKQTGIALQDVVQFLKQTPTKNVMMVLDINRSQSALAGQAIGEQVIKLAEKARIPLIMSCQPTEFSHETLAVRHGLFTAGLLEGLRYDGCATLSHLEQYLVERIPELCENHWRPIQNPVVLLPEEQKFQLLWHQRDVSSATEPIEESDAALIAIPSETDIEADMETEELLSEPEELMLENPENLEVDLGDDVDDLIPESELILEDELPEEPVRDSLSLEVEETDNSPDSNIVRIDDDDAYGTTLVEDVPDDEPRKNQLGGCLPWLGALAALLLLGAVLFRNQPLVQNALQGRVPPEWLARIGMTPDGTAGDTGDDDTSGSGETPPEQPGGEAPVDNAVPDNADIADGSADGSTPDNEPKEPEAETPETPNGEPSGNPDTASEGTVDTAAESAVDSPENGADAAKDPESGAAGTETNAAETEAAEAETETAAETETETTGADGVVASGNTTTGSSTENADSDAKAQPSDTGVLLEKARRSLRPSQASRFASAIATARQIPPGDPNYSQAQADIQRWSRVILDLAEGRAAETQLKTAIDAAKLVPREPADVYKEAQEHIQTWEARARTRSIIREAQAIPRMGQASTYQKGILKLQEVPASQPIEYTDAQRLIGEWTAKMLTIARARAAQGQYGSALEAAVLIPKNTPNYDQAQAEIQRWRGQ